MTRRYAVTRIDRFGDSTELSYWDSLEDALKERDIHRAEQIEYGRYREAFIVIDVEDRLRGPLNHTDAYTEA